MPILVYEHDNLILNFPLYNYMSYILYTIQVNIIAHGHEHFHVAAILYMIMHVVTLCNVCVQHVRIHIHEQENENEKI